MNGSSSVREPPCFVRRKNSDRGKKLAKSAKNLAHCCLTGTAPGRIRSIAIQPILGDIYIETAEVHRAKLVQGVVDPVELERLVGGTAFPGYFIQAFQDPAVHQRRSRGR